ncbi:MAG TPA: IclR family transcriptional regulator [Flexivirga sp.]|uniref:IclR family transcriptional regulator n=1 Tax=Flexivirga sp. TaxID=1962927 RepID=UPI002BE8B27C|nr:IclR family transcriptional regulator [Flexivirga sp.]HWC21672.1 IclR family transcriptional regulator [Flexivirga sp.]
MLDLPLTGNMIGMAGNSSVAGRSVTSRALALLGAFDERHRQLSLSELAARSELPLATAHRLVNELVDWGALARTPSGYVVGRRLWDVGLLAPVNTGLREVAAPYLHDLYGATLATVHLAVRDGRHALYVERLSGHASVPVVSTVGSRLPLHATGVGKVLLAFAPEELRRQVLSDLPRVTRYTISEPGRLQRQLDKVRADDFATTQEEMSLGACSAAVPVRVGESVVASLGVVVPTLKRDQARLVSAMQVAARGIGRSLRPV